ncbi:transmembrane protein 145-like [Antedon mediterranea]|uniref:transmembrane protein 145-like n=1 Tax=Antedon mediterranea TaxID=105859 RepID=UPI003AF5CB30
MDTFFKFIGLIIIFGTQSTVSKHVSGTINEKQQNFVFLSRFVFQPNEYGELVFNFHYPLSECCYQFLIFNDDVTQWPFIRKHEDTLTCLEKQGLLDGSFRNTVNLSQPTNCKINSDNEQELFCFGQHTFEHSDERWWYLTIANCKANGILNLHYNINMTNGHRLIDRHFSADERHILETNVVFLGLYCVILFSLCRFKSVMHQRRLLHASYQVFCWSCYIQTLSIFLQAVALIEYATNGIGLPNLEMIGEILSSCSSITFVLLLILVAKGYTVTRARLRPVTSLKICILMTCYCITYSSLYVYREIKFDPRDVISKYASVAGYGLIILQFIGMLWMYYAGFFTIKKNANKINFYLIFLAVFTFWFLAVPITVWMSNSLIAKLKRTKIINGVEHATLLYGHFIFLSLTRPSADNTYFPFYLKSNKVDIVTTHKNATECDIFSSVIICDNPMTKDDNISMPLPSSPLEDESPEAIVESTAVE